MAYLPSEQGHVGKTWTNPLEWNNQRIHWLAEAEKARDFYTNLRKRYQYSPVFAQTTYQADYGRRLPPISSNQTTNFNDLKFKFGRNAAISTPNNDGTVSIPPTETYNMDQLKNCPQLDFLRRNQVDRSANCEEFAKKFSNNEHYPSMLQHINQQPYQNTNENYSYTTTTKCTGGRRCECGCTCCGTGSGQNLSSSCGGGGGGGGGCGSNANPQTFCTEMRNACTTYNNVPPQQQPQRPYSASAAQQPCNSTATCRNLPRYDGTNENVSLRRCSARTERPATSLDDRLAADTYYDYTTTTTNTGDGGGGGNGDFSTSTNVSRAWNNSKNIPPRYKTLLVTDNAERLRAKSNQICVSETEAAKNNQSEVERQLADRVADTNFWRSELRNEANEMAQEMAKLRHVRSQLERRARELEGPLSTNAECQEMRAKLKLATGDARNNNGEQVDKDRADQEMQTEYDMLQRYQQRLGALIQQCDDKLQQEEQIFRELEADGSDKFDAMTIDKHCQRMQLTSPEVDQFKNSRQGRGTSNGQQFYMSDPQSWIENSERKLRLSRNLRNDSQKQRIEAERLLSQMSSELMAQCHAVNDELLKKSIFNEQRKMRVREQYTKTCMRINDLERDVEMLARVLQSRNSPLSLAQTRQAARTARPNMDLCNDQVEHKLRDEINALQASTQRLNDQLRAVQYNLAELRQVKAGMETEMLNAATNVYVDREKCLGMRKQYPVLFRAGTPNVGAAK